VNWCCARGAACAGTSRWLADAPRPSAVACARSSSSCTNPDLYRVVAQSQFVDQAVFRRSYEEFAAGYVKGLRAAEKRGEIRKGDAEVYAWALMGICDMVGRGSHFGMQRPR
jgi:hypothetical protein